jgi:hypothetical protein
MTEWKDQGFNSRQAKTLAAAEAGAMNYEQSPVTQAAWDALAKQAYDPCGAWTHIIKAGDTVCQRTYNQGFLL